MRWQHCEYRTNGKRAVTENGNMRNILPEPIFCKLPDTSTWAKKYEDSDWSWGCNRALWLGPGKVGHMGAILSCFMSGSDTWHVTQTPYKMSQNVTRTSQQPMLSLSHLLKSIKLCREFIDENIDHILKWKCQIEHPLWTCLRSV